MSFLSWILLIIMSDLAFQICSCSHDLSLLPSLYLFPKLLFTLSSQVSFILLKLSFFPLISISFHWKSGIIVSFCGYFITWQFCIWLTLLDFLSPSCKLRNETCDWNMLYMPYSDPSGCLSIRKYLFLIGRWLWRTSFFSSIKCKKPCFTIPFFKRILC